MKWHTAKPIKYEEEIRPNLLPGWTLHVVAGEVGAKGWVPPTFTKDLRKLFGFAKSKANKLADDCASVARRCSYVIWRSRNNRDFDPF